MDAQRSPSPVQIKILINGGRYSLTGRVRMVDRSHSEPRRRNDVERERNSRDLDRGRDRERRSRSPNRNQSRSRSRNSRQSRPHANNNWEQNGNLQRATVPEFYYQNQRPLLPHHAVRYPAPAWYGGPVPCYMPRPMMRPLYPRMMRYPFPRPRGFLDANGLGFMPYPRPRFP